MDDIRLLTRYLGKVLLNLDLDFGISTSTTFCTNPVFNCIPSRHTEVQVKPQPLPFFFFFLSFFPFSYYYFTFCFRWAAAYPETKNHKPSFFRPIYSVSSPFFPRFLALSSPGFSYYRLPRVPKATHQPAVIVQLPPRTDLLLGTDLVSRALADAQCMVSRTHARTHARSFLFVVSPFFSSPLRPSKLVGYTQDE